MNNFILQLHSGIRWLVVLATLIALVWMLLGLVQKRQYDRMAQRVMTSFSGLVTLQWLIGIILFLALGAFNITYRWEHAFTMTIAVAVSHMHRRSKNADDSVRYRNSLIIVAVVLIVIFIGVSLLPQGWKMSPSV